MYVCIRGYMVVQSMHTLFIQGCMLDDLSGHELRDLLHYLTTL